MKNLIKLSLITFLFYSCNKDDKETFKKEIDLSTSISSELVSQTTPFSGTVKITGVIKNIGNSDFLSGSNQQKAYLILKPVGSSTEITLEELDFTSLTKGTDIKISTTKTWSTSDEFPPSFFIRIVYSNTGSDGNEKNDDINSSNNSSELLPNSINELF